MISSPGDVADYFESILGATLEQAIADFEPSA